MRNGAIALMTLALVACAAPGTQEEPGELDAADAPAATEPAPQITQSESPTFWDLAPLGNGEHIRVHVDDRARAGDCEELDATFEKWAADEPVEGFTHELLAYIDQQRKAAGCAS